MKIETLKALLTAAEKTIAPVAEVYGEGDPGGYIYICNPNGNMVAHVMIGTPPSEKAGEYEKLSKEKARRLRSYVDHTLSWESRDTKANQYGGAIRLPNKFIISFSGFPEMIDQAFCLALAVRFNLIEITWVFNSMDQMMMSVSCKEFLRIFAAVSKIVTENTVDGPKKE